MRYCCRCGPCLLICVCYHNGRFGYGNVNTFYHSKYVGDYGSQTKYWKITLGKYYWVTAVEVVNGYRSAYCTAERAETCLKRLDGAEIFVYKGLLVLPNS